MAGETYSFGVAATVTGKTGYLIQSVSKTTTGDVAEARDNTGNVKVVQCYNKNSEITFEAIVPTSDTPPDFGTVVTVDSINYYVTNTTLTESNTDYNKFSCTAKRYVTNSIPSSASV